MRNDSHLIAWVAIAGVGFVVGTWLRSLCGPDAAQGPMAVQVTRTPVLSASPPPVATPSHKSEADVRRDLQSRIAVGEFSPLLTPQDAASISANVLDSEISVLSRPKQELMEVVKVWESLATKTKRISPATYQDYAVDAATKNGQYSEAGFRAWIHDRRDIVRSCFGMGAVFPGQVVLEATPTVLDFARAEGGRLVLFRVSRNEVSIFPGSTAAGRVLLQQLTGKSMDWNCINDLLLAAAMTMPPEPLPDFSTITIAME